MLKDVLKRIKDERIEFIDLMYMGLLGVWHHLTLPAERFDERICSKGVGVDGSSVTGFRKVKSGDMVLVPDLTTTFIHPFAEHRTLCILGDLVDVDAHEGFSRDARFIARKAEAYLAKTRRGEKSLWLPELEFYLFDGIRVWGRPGISGFEITSRESGAPDGTPETPEHEGQRKGYHCAAPEDRFEDLRSEMCTVLRDMGIPVKYHHHEVGSAGQVEIELNFMPMVRGGDCLSLAKWAVRNLAQLRGVIATFMPKPLYGEAGSGLHFHQYLTKGSRSAFYTSKKGHPLSDVGRWYVGGLIKHGRAISAFANASTNSFKRLVPGFEAPVRLAYSVGNRTTAIRVPGYANTPENVRIEYRAPDATCNGHLTMAAMLMAGLDGIRNKIDPGPPVKGDIFALPKREQKKIPALPPNLSRALDALEKDHAFLLEGDVFTEDIIEAWLEIKRKEEKDIVLRPHPREFERYLGV